MPEIRDQALTQKLTYATSGYGANQPEYIGYAQPGSGTAAEVWKIQKITYGSNNQPSDIQWADGSREFNKAWASRTTYTYS